jgi:hypothetical protein
MQEGYLASMKNKISLVLSLAFTLVILIGLIVPAASISAGVSSWTDAGLPSKFIDGSNITAMAVSPDRNTILVHNGKYEFETEPGDYNGFLKSTDGGINFTSQGLNDPYDEDLFKYFDGCTKIAFSPEFATDKVIVAVASVDGNFDAYITYDSGKSWEWLVDSPGDIVGADVSYDSNGKLSILLGTSDTVWLYTEKSGNRWMGVSEAGNFYNGDVLDVKFSPNYADDAMVLALTNSDVDGETMAVLQNVIIENHVETMNWNESYKPVVFEVDGEYVFANSGFLAIGDNYNANGGKVFIALDSEDKDEVFRVSMSTGSALKNAVSMNANEEYDIDEICSLDYKAGKLAVGTDKDIKVNIKADTSTSADDWSSAADETTGKVPSGVNMLVAFSANAAALYAATANYTDSEYEDYDIEDGTFGSVFALSSDYKSFDGISLINVEDENLVTVKYIEGAGTNTQYIMMNANVDPASPWYAPVQILFKSTDSGQNWKEIKSNIATIYDESPDNSELFNGMEVTGDDIWIPMKESHVIHSSNGGVTFDDTTNVRTRDDKILAFSGGTDYWIGGPQGEIFKNNSRTPRELEDIDSHEIFSLNVNPGFFVVLTTPFEYGPPNGPIYFSGDDGATFKKLAEKNITSTTFDIPKRLIYGLEENTNDIFSFNVDTSEDWTKVCTIQSEDSPDFTATDINLSSSGVLYVKGFPSDDQYPQYLSSINFDKPSPAFESIHGSSADDLHGTFQRGPTDIVVDSKVSILFKPLNLTDPPTSEGHIISLLKTYTDLTAAPLYITNDPVLPDGEAKANYSQTLQVVKGTAPYTWSLKKGSKLPSGLTLKTDKPDTSTAKISGKPSKSPPLNTAYTYSFTVVVKDSKKASTEKTFTLLVVPELKLISTGSPEGEKDIDFEWIPEAQGGNGNYSWAITKGTLPDGLNFNSSTGAITGVPEAKGTDRVTLTLTDTLQGAVNKNLTIKIFNTLEIKPVTLPEGEEGISYKSTVIKATGGSGKYTWFIPESEEVLPPGMYFDKNTIKGTPEDGSAGEYYFTIEVSDEYSSASQEYILYINHELKIIDPGIPEYAVVDDEWDYELTADDGVGPYKCSISGKLPKGVKLVAVKDEEYVTTYYIKGKLTKAGTYTFTIKVTDSLKKSVTQTITTIVEALE